MQAGERGFTLLGLLAAVTVTLLAVQSAVTVWSHVQQRERERDLIRIGSAYALALERYQQLSPGNLKQFPQDLNALARDTRFVGTMRHLRRVYDDPMRPGQPWQILRDAQGRIVGVFSGSDKRPVAEGAADLRGVPLPPGPTYAQWVFRAREVP
jgi:type II secretory pathway pseudopilin PulG